MDIASSVKRASFRQSPSARKPEDATAIPPDAIDLRQLPPDAKRVRPIESTFESMELKATVLERPLLMVHGLAQHADTFAAYKNHLVTEPQNRWGGVYNVDREQEFLSKKDPEARLFAVDISDNLAAPRVVANEIRRAITAIMEKTGAESVDVVTHSMGALVTREALRQGEDGIANLAMISPPNHGSYEATAATFLGDSRVYQHYPAAKLGAMDALRLEFGPLGGVSNEWLHGLNNFWEQDKDRPRAAVITGIGIPTPDASATATSPGDGMVAARQAPLTGAEFHLAVPNKLPAGDPNFRDFQEFRYNHLQIISEPEIWRTAAEFLEGGEGKARTRQSFEDAVKQAEASNRKIRNTVDSAEKVRLSHHNKQKLATRLAVAGAASAALGLAANSVPILGPALMLGGTLALGAGAIYGVRSAESLGLDSREAVNSAETALNLADSLLHRYQRNGRQETLQDLANSDISKTMDKTRSQRTSLVEADYERRYRQRWQSRGMHIAGLGAVVGAAGLLGQAFAPSILGQLGMATGGLTLLGGSALSIIHSAELGTTSGEASRMASKAVDLADEVVAGFKDQT